jgi:hypothetical protein
MTAEDPAAGPGPDPDASDVAGEADDSDDGTVQVWLVWREYDDRNLVTLRYATPDGERVYERQQSASVMRGRNVEVTAAREVDAAALQPVDDSERVERYAAEVTRVRDEYDPDDPI